MGVGATDGGGGTVLIGSRFHGPPESGNGGYTCGLAAAAVDAPAVQVRSKLPPPLERPLAVEHRDDVVVLVDGDEVVAEARAADVYVECPAPVDLASAQTAVDRFDVDAYDAGHAFPGCFTCGPHRAQGDGLRIFPASVEGRPDLVASPWVPDASCADDDGVVRDEITWAALDCPGGLVWMVGDDPVGAAVLGQLVVAIDRRPHVGEELVVAGWRVGADGRKRRSGTVIWYADGEVLAQGEAIWIVLAEDQHAAFNTSAG